MTRRLRWEGKSSDRLGFGIFMAPFHVVGENPKLALQRDFKLIT